MNFSNKFFFDNNNIHFNAKKPIHRVTHKPGKPLVTEVMNDNAKANERENRRFIQSKEPNLKTHNNQVAHNHSECPYASEQAPVKPWFPQVKENQIELAPEIKEISEEIIKVLKLLFECIKSSDKSILMNFLMLFLKNNADTLSLPQKNDEKEQESEREIKCKSAVWKKIDTSQERILMKSKITADLKRFSGDEIGTALLSLEQEGKIRLETKPTKGRHATLIIKIDCIEKGGQSSGLLEIAEKMLIPEKP